jgi:hypothetical protein
MLDLPALVKKKAGQSAYKLLDSYKPNTGDFEGLRSSRLDTYAINVSMKTNKYSSYQTD